MIECMVSKGKIAISIVLVVLSLIAVGISFIYLNRSYQNMTRANEKAKIAYIDLRDSSDNMLRALRQHPDYRSQADIDQYNLGVDQFNRGCLSYGFPQKANFSG